MSWLGIIRRAITVKIRSIVPFVSHISDTNEMYISATPKALSSVLVLYQALLSVSLRTFIVDTHEKIALSAIVLRRRN